MSADCNELLGSEWEMNFEVHAISCLDYLIAVAKDSFDEIGSTG